MSFTRVSSVKSATYALLKKNPPDLVISAEGEVPTSGWNNGALGAWIYIQPPQDGIQDLDFIAEKPSGVILPKVSSISGDAVFADIDFENFWGKGKPLNGFRIHSQSNVLEVKINTDNDLEARSI